MTQDIHIQLWSASLNGAGEDAERLLDEAAKRNEAAMVDLGNGEIYWGWHPLVGRFLVGRRSPDAPTHLPAYMARLRDAEHVHAGGTNAEEAVGSLLGLFTAAAERLE